MKPGSAKLGPRLCIVGAALLFSTGGAAIKATSLSSWQVAGFRSLAAACFLVLVLSASRRNWSLRAFAVGAAYAATMILFVSGNKLTTSANTIFLQSTAPLYILLLSPLLLHERIQKRDSLFLFSLAAGLSLFFLGIQSPSDTAPDPERGNFLAAISGVSWALTIIGLRWLGVRREGRGGETLSAIAIGNLLAFVFCAPLAFPIAESAGVDWVVVVFLGVFQIGLAYVFLTKGLKSVPALEASILLLLEPVLNPLWSWILHGEDPGIWALLGGLIILGSCTGKSLLDSRLPTDKSEAAHKQALNP